MKEQINQCIRQLAKDAVPGSKQYISAYQLACTQVVDGLTPAQRADCERLSEQWNATGPDATTRAM
jgi:hypothetical protein